MNIRWPAFAAVSLIALGAWFANRPAAAPRIAEITSAPGQQTMPSLSPDGERVAYVWNEADGASADIYVQSINGSVPLRLTNHPGADLLPSWSPDGTQIAFVRTDAKTGIYVVSAQGGGERKLMEFEGEDTRPPGPATRIFANLLNPIASRPSWTPDGKFLAVSRFSNSSLPDDGSVLLLPVDGGAPGPFLPRLPTWHYSHPIFSPDGRQLAVSICGKSTFCEIQVMSVTPDLRPVGPSRELMRYRDELRGMAWTADGRSLLVAGFAPPEFYTFRLDVEEPWKQEKLLVPGAIWPSVSARGGRIAVSRSIPQADLWKLEPGGTPKEFLSSAEAETHPRISPSGDRVAFYSTHEGIVDLGTARLDGSERRVVARDVGRGFGSPDWSPDGSRIAYDAVREKGAYQIWTVDAAGGKPRQISSGSLNHGGPRWSPDGSWIFFQSFAVHSSQLLRMRSTGEDAETVLREEGTDPAVSADGKTIYFLRHKPGIWAVPVGGGAERRIVSDPVILSNYHVAREGIYYMTETSDPEWCEIRFFDFATNQSRLLTRVAQPVAWGLAATPGGGAFIWSHTALHSKVLLLESVR